MTAAQTLVKAFSLDEASHQLGLVHGRLGLPWHCPEASDMLAYSLGHAEGLDEAHTSCCGGDVAQPGSMAS